MTPSVLIRNRQLQNQKRIRVGLKHRTFTLIRPLTETERVLRDPALMAAIKQSEREVREGDTVSAEEAHAKLGW